MTTKANEGQAVQCDLLEKRIVDATESKFDVTDAPNRKPNRPTNVATDPPTNQSENRVTRRLRRRERLRRRGVARTRRWSDADRLAADRRRPPHQKGRAPPPPPVPSAQVRRRRRRRRRVPDGGSAPLRFHFGSDNCIGKRRRAERKGRRHLGSLPAPFIESMASESTERDDVGFAPADPQIKHGAFLLRTDRSEGGAAAATFWNTSIAFQVDSVRRCDGDGGATRRRIARLDDDASFGTVAAAGVARGLISFQTSGTEASVITAILSRCPMDRRCSRKSETRVGAKPGRHRSSSPFRETHAAANENAKGAGHPPGNEPIDRLRRLNLMNFSLLFPSFFFDDFTMGRAGPT